MGIKALVRRSPVIFPVHVTAGEAPAGKQVFTADRDYQIESITEVHVAAGAASSTLLVERVASGVAPASGTDILDAGFLLDSTVDIPVTKSRANGGITTPPTSILKAGESLTLDFTGTTTNYEGVVTIVLTPVTGL